MAARNKSESESRLESALPLITQDNCFDTHASAEYNSTSTVEDYAKQWALSVSKRWVFRVTLRITLVADITDSYRQNVRRTWSVCAFDQII